MEFVLNTFYIQTLMSAVLAGVSFYRYGERDALMRIVGLIFLISFTFNVVQYLSFAFRIVELNFVGSLYDYTVIITTTILYNRMTEFKHQRLFLFISSAVFLWSVTNQVFIQTGVEAATSYSKLTVSFMSLVFSILYFYRLMKDLPTVYLHRLPSFWFNSGVLIFAAGSIILLAVLDTLIQKEDKLIGIYWGGFHNILFIIQQVIFLIGVVYDLKRVRLLSNRSDGANN